MTSAGLTTANASSVEDARSALPALLDEAAAIPGMAAQPLELLRSKVRAHAFNLVVCGEFKRGKSSLINALLGAEVLPTAVVPLTSVVTLLVHAETPAVDVVFDSGERRTVTLDRLPDYVTERGNPGNAKGVREVAVAWPAPWLAGGIRLADTPGIGSIHQHNTDITRAYLPEADAVIFVASVDQPLSRNELDFLAEIRGHAGKVFCLLNKIDHLTESELAESTAFATQVLREALGEDVPVFPVSARLALQGRLVNDAALVERSRLPAFDGALRSFLAHDRGAVWVRAIGQHLRRLLDEVGRSAQFELAALSTPLELLDTKLAAFAVKKAETLQARSDFEALLDADGKRLVRERLGPEIDAFGKRLLARLNALLKNWYAELRPQGSAALQAGLEARLVDEVRLAFDGWRIEQDALLRVAFDQLCSRYSGRVRQIVDELLTFSAGLFDIAVAAGTADSPWRLPAGFSYKFWDTPPSLLLIRNALVLALPGGVGHPIILRDAQRRAVDLVSMQAGRLSYDFEERVKRNLSDFRRAMAEQIAATIGEIEAAIDKGKALREQGESAMRRRQGELTATLEAAQALRHRVDGLT
jgi:GTPase SAR1 family protein